MAAHRQRPGAVIISARASSVTGFARRPMLLILLAAVTLSFANNQSVGIAIPIFLTRDLGGSASDVGLVGALATAGAVCGRLIAGWLASRSNRTTILVGGSLLILLLSSLYPATGSLVSVAGARFLHLLAFAVVTSTAVITVAEIVRAERRGAALAAIGMAMPISALIFPAVAAGILDARLGEVAVLATGLSLAAAVLFAAVRVGGDNLAGGQLPTVVEVPAPLPNAPFLAIVAAAMIGATDAVAVDLLPILSVERGISGYGWFYSAFALSMVGALVVLQRTAWHDRAREVARAGLVASGVAFGLLAIAHDLPTLLLVAVVYGVGFAAGQTGLSVGVATTLNSVQRGSQIAGLYLSFEIGRGVGVYAVGSAATIFGFAAPLLLVGACCIFWSSRLIRGATRA